MHAYGRVCVSLAFAHRIEEVSVAEPSLQHALEHTYVGTCPSAMRRAPHILRALCESVCAYTLSERCAVHGERVTRRFRKRVPVCRLYVPLYCYAAVRVCVCV